MFAGNDHYVQLFMKRCTSNPYASFYDPANNGEELAGLNSRGAKLVANRMELEIAAA